MGCALSRQDEEDDVVSLCRERKRLLKLAVERRYAFADAQYKYNQALYTVAMALRLFVARHSSQSSPFLITFPCKNSTCNDQNGTLITNSMFLQQRPTEPIHETRECKPSDCKVSLASPHLGTGKEETEEENTADTDDEVKSGEKESDDVDVKSGEKESESESENGDVCEHFYESESAGSVACEHFFESETAGTVASEHFYSEAGPPVPSPQRELGWDFFYPFDEMRTHVVNRFSSQGSDEDLRALREKEGIPELEEEEQRMKSDTEPVTAKNGDVGGQSDSVATDVRSGDNANPGLEASEGLKRIDTPTRGRELLEALKDIEDHFIRAYDSGLEISRMLEANRVQLLSGFEEIKESSNKLVRSLTWNRSALSRSSSSKSLLTSSSRSSSMWTEFKNDTFDEYAMDAGSHSLTLGRLYAWEKKLYDEVKAGDLTRKAFERKCSHMRNECVKEDGNNSIDKRSSEVKDLHARISVAMRSAESISDRIQKLRDEELHPQLLELLHGLMRSWKIMLESHETQNRVMLEVKSFDCPDYQKFSNDSHYLATLQLEAELDNWRSCFVAYVSAQKEYIEAITGWLSKFIAPEVELYSSSNKSSFPHCRFNWPPLLVTCHEWLACLDRLPFKDVTCAMKNFSKEIHALKSQQGEEQQQKRKADGLAKELDKRTLAFQRTERRILESKISESEASALNPIEYLAEKKKLLDMFRQRVDKEQEKHRSSMQETKLIIINGFQTGFSSVFESLTEFSKASVTMYNDVLRYTADAEAAHQSDSNPRSGMGSQVY